MNKTPKTAAAMKWLEGEFISNDIVEHIRTTMFHLEIELLAAQAELRQIKRRKDNE